MAEDTVTSWLVKRGQRKNLSIELAKQLAAESRLGWYIAPHGHKRYLVGKVTLQKLSMRHIVTDDEGNALTFGSEAEARAFLRDELKILTPHFFNY